MWVSEILTNNCATPESAADEEVLAAQFSARHPHSLAAVVTELDRYDPRLGVKPTALSSFGAP
jgi:hypothetical protein